MPFSSRFELDEAKALAAMLAELENSTAMAMPPVPREWLVLFTSRNIGGYENLWQLRVNAALNCWARAGPKK